MGHNLILLLQRYWETQQAALKQRGCYGSCFKTERGVTQGDIVSPTLFNLVIDIVVRNLYASIEHKNSPDSSFPPSCVFYTDDGYTGGTDACNVKGLLTITLTQFMTYGLTTNCLKTKVMISNPHIYRLGISKEGYKRMLNRELPTFTDRMLKPTECNICGSKLQVRSLPNHMLRVHNLDKFDLATSGINHHTLSSTPRTINWSRKMFTFPHADQGCP